MQSRHVSQLPTLSSIYDYDRDCTQSFDVGLTAREVIRRRGFWLLTVYMGIMFVGNSGFQTHQIAYFESAGLSTGSAAATVVVVSVLSGVGRMGAGALVDVVDYRLVLVGTAAMMAGAFFYLALVTVGSLLLTMPFNVLFAIAFGSTIPLRAVIGSLMFGTKSLGAVIGLISGSSIAAGVAGPVLMGYVFDTTGVYDASLWVLAIITLPAIFLPLLMRGRSMLPETSEVQVGIPPVT